VLALRPPSEPGTLVVSVSGCVAPEDIAPMCRRAHALLQSTDARRLVWDVRSLGDPDAVTVDALARLQLTARRLGHRGLLRHASPRLSELLAMVGLCDVLPACDELSVESLGKAEQREEPGRVEEERDPGDDPV
jgi:hypothetical protein